MYIYGCAGYDYTLTAHPLMIARYTHFMQHVHTYTLTHFETMPGADAEFEDQYSVILSALFDIHRHSPLNP